MLKNKIFYLAAMFIFLQIPGFCAPKYAAGGISIPPAAEALQRQKEVVQNSVKEVVTPHIEDIKEMTLNANKEVKNEVLKDTNNTLNLTVKKFAYAMLGILISSIAIFLILLIMNKMTARQGISLTKKNDECSRTDEMGTPNGENEALKIFFEKTR